MEIEERNRYERERYALLKKLHLCVRCRKQDAYTMSGRASCAECAEKDAKVHRESERERERRKERYYENVDRLRLDGICTNCGKRPARAGHTKCGTCLAMISRWHKREREKKGLAPVEVLRELGMCGICLKEPVAEGHKVCAACLEQKQKSVAYARTFIKNRQDFSFKNF